MAVRFDAVADYLSRSADLPGNDVSLTFDVLLSVDKNTQGYMFILMNGTGTVFQGVQVTTDGTTIRLVTNTGGTSGSNLSLSQWYHVDYYRNGSSHAMRVDGGSWITFTDAATFTPAFLFFGSSSATSIDGRIANIKLWNGVQLTDAEFDAERQTIRPHRTANLYGFWPLFPGSSERARDYSGNGRNFTENGTLTDEDHPPVAWGGASVWGAYAAVAGGGTAHEGAATINGVSSVTTVATSAHSTAAAIDGVSTVTTNATSAYAAAATITGVSTVTGAATSTHAGTVVANGVSAVAVGATSSYVGAAVIAGVSSVTVAASTSGSGVDHVGAATINGVSTLTALATSNHAPIAAVGGVSSVTAFGTSAHGATVAIEGASTVTVAGVASFSGTALISGLSTVVIVGEAAGQLPPFDYPLSVSLGGVRRVRLGTGRKVILG